MEKYPAGGDRELVAALALERDRRQQMLVLNQQLAVEVSKKTREAAKGMFTLFPFYGYFRCVYFR